MTLSVSVLGPPVVLADDVPLAVDTRKATALLAYLVVEGGVHNRDSLAELLWPDYAPDPRARRCGGRSRRCARRSAAAG